MQPPTPKQTRMHAVIAALQIYHDHVDTAPPRFIILGEIAGEECFFSLCHAFRFDALEFYRMLPSKSLNWRNNCGV